MKLHSNRCIATSLLPCWLVLAALAFGAPPLPDGPATAPAVVLSITGKVARPSKLSADAFAALAHQDVKVTDKDGKEIVYSGVLLDSLLADAGVQLGTGHGRNEALTLGVMVEAVDGYTCLFSIAELDEKLAGRHIILADRRDGRLLDAKEGPLRLIVSGDTRPVRWVRQVNALRVVSPG